PEEHAHALGLHRAFEQLEDLAFLRERIEQAAQAVKVGKVLEPQQARLPGNHHVFAPGYQDLFGQVGGGAKQALHRSEEHTSELQSRENLVCRLLLEKKKGSSTGIAS